MLKEENVELEVMVLSDGFSIYALKINSKLFGIERKSSQLKVLKVLENVTSNQSVVDDCGDVVILVTFNDNRQQLTKFLDDDLEEFLKNKSSQRFNEIYESVSQKETTVRNQLKVLKKEVEELSLKLREEIPVTMLHEVSEGRLKVVVDFVGLSCGFFSIS
jgi:hypothetical protein